MKKDVENEKKSLLTVIKLLQTDPNNNIKKPDQIEIDDTLKDEYPPHTSNSTSTLLVSFKEDL